MALQTVPLRDNCHAARLRQLNLQIQEYDVPTPQSPPHDPRTRS